MKRLNSFDNAKAQFYTIAHFALLVIVMQFAFIVLMNFLALQLTMSGELRARLIKLVSFVMYSYVMHMDA